MRRLSFLTQVSLGILLCAGLLVSCTVAGSPVRTPTETQTPSSLGRPQPSPTLAGQQGLAETPTPGPTSPPMDRFPSGALLVHSDTGVGLVRPDTAKVERLIEGCANRFGESVGGTVPFTTSRTTGEDCDVTYAYEDYYYDQRLYVVASPEYSVREITPLLSFYDMARDADTMVDVPDELLYASVANAWSVPALSPDGRYLAFAAAIDGPSSDLYLYDTELDEITRKSSGANQAMDPIWAPDSSGALHYEYIFAPSDFDRFLYAPVALWWAPVGSGALKKMSQGDYPRFWGWLDEAHFVVWHSDLSGPLGVGDITTGETTYLLEQVDRAATLQTAQGGSVLAAVSEDPQPDRLVLIDGSTRSIMEIPLQINSSSLAMQAVDSFERFLVASYQHGLFWVTDESLIIPLDDGIQPRQLFLSPDGRKAIAGGSTMETQWLYVFDEGGNLSGQYPLPDHVLDYRGRSWRPDSKVYILECDDRSTTYIQEPAWDVQTTSLGCPLWYERQAVLWSE